MLRRLVFCLFLNSFSQVFAVGSGQKDTGQGYIVHQDVDSASSSLNADLQRIKPPINHNVIQSISRYYTFSSYRLETGSNAIPLSISGKLALGGYISPKQTREVFDKLSSNNRAGALQEFNILLYPTIGISKSVPNQKGILRFSGLFYVNSGYYGANLTKDAFGLFLRGNTPFLGEKLNVGSNQFKQLQTQSLRFNFDVKPGILGSRNSLFSQISFGQVLGFNSSGTDGMHLYSSKTGDSLNFNGSAYTQVASAQNGGAGWGMQLGLNFYHNNKTGKTQYNFWLHDFGFWDIRNVQTWSRGVQWNANSLTPQSWNKPADLAIIAVNLGASDLRFSNWFDRQKDTLEAKINFQESKQRGLILSPFHVGIGINYTSQYLAMGDGKFLRNMEIRHLVDLSYRHWIGYVPKLQYQLQLRSMNLRNWTWIPGVSVGGFDVFDVNFKGSYYINKVIKRSRINTTMRFELNGIESFIFPSKFHGGGGYLSLSIPFSTK